MQPQGDPAYLGCEAKRLGQKERCMESEEYDFTRNPVVQNEVFFLAIEVCVLWLFSSGALN